MRKSSQIILAVCLVLLFALGFAYVTSRASDASLTREQANQIVHQLQEAVAHKNVNTVMSYIDPSPETKVANITQDQLRILLARAFRTMNNPHADIDNIAFAGGETGDATIDFDLNVKQTGADYNAFDYKGHISLHLKRVDVPHLLGLYQTKEWRIVGGSTTGPQPGNMGD